MKKYIEPPNSYFEPPEDPEPMRCPMCGEETDTFMKDYFGEICGCDKCVTAVDAWDYAEEG